MKKISSNFYFYFFFSLGLSFVSCKTKKANIAATHEITLQEKAQLELPAMLNKIPEGSEKLYGFENRNEINAAKLGAPFKYYSLNDTSLVPTANQQFPVMVGEEFRGIATAEMKGEKIKIVDFGANILSKEIQETQRKYSTKTFLGLLRIYKITSDFAILYDKNGQFYVPLTSAKMFLTSIGVSNSKNHYTLLEVSKFITMAK